MTWSGYWIPAFAGMTKFLRRQDLGGLVAAHKLG
jgi:hypothetical protein